MKQPLKSPIEKLKEKIEKFIARTGMKPTAFGRGAVNDPNLLKRLAEDRFPTLRNVDRIEQFMRDWKCPPQINGHSLKPVSLTEAFPNQCRWVLYEPRSLIICGAQVVPGRPYCLMHLQLSIDGKRVQA